MAEVPFDKITAYCCEDVDCTLRLKRLFEKDLTALQLQPLFQHIEIPLITVLAKMEQPGIFVDVPKLEKMSVELKKELKELEDEIYLQAGETFNREFAQAA